MAKRYRIETGLKDVQQADLSRFIELFSPYQTALLDAIEAGDTAKIETIFKNANLPAETEASARIRLSTLVSQLPSREQGYRTYIDQTKDEANATDVELQNRLAAYQGLEQTGEPLDINSIRAGISDLMGGNGLDKLFVMTELPGAGQGRAKDYEEGKKYLDRKSVV